jgi:hypothetical protein
VIPADRFHIPVDGPPKQGDILLAGVARLVAGDRFTPRTWARLDACDITAHVADGNVELRLTAGPALVMVTSHDCHFDKEWNRRRTSLIEEGFDAETATRTADADETLDRTFNASPLLRPEEVGRDRGLLMAGKVIGYFPVPASPDGLVPEAVVDLTYRVTLDRLAITRSTRFSCIGVDARSQLRYALARLDSLRAPSIGFDLEAVVGRQIERVEVPRKQPLFVRLHLDDGTSIDLLQHPGEPAAGPARAVPPGRTA